MKVSEYSWEMRRSLDTSGPSGVYRTFQYGTKSVLFWGEVRALYTG